MNSERPTIGERRGDARPRVARRRLLAAGGVAGAAALAGSYSYFWPRRSPVFIARQRRYDGSLVSVIRDGLEAIGINRRSVRSRSVLLKPSLAEPCGKAPHRSTHKAVVLAAAEVFLQWGARVTVGEGSGHIRDTELVFVESGLWDDAYQMNVACVDLNYEDVIWRQNVGGKSDLAGFFLPKSVVDADLIVSLPKLKTHHWVAMTASMKNMYGVLPGVEYGWPKNVLHHSGIPETIFDINAVLPNTIAIVDGIVGMQGDGPILGTPKPAGLLIVGADLVAVDAACARIMGFNPLGIEYLRMADRRLGIADTAMTVELGERVSDVISPFAIPRSALDVRARARDNEPRVEQTDAAS